MIFVLCLRFSCDKAHVFISYTVDQTLYWTFRIQLFMDSFVIIFATDIGRENSLLLLMVLFGQREFVCNRYGLIY